mmetsp:Transcript_54551/g.158480  ORF Transcript_54551/g.158480 Transcript_54551/m.158480 type:complete len:101 (-) Transcript_54551:72-374(-)
MGEVTGQLTTELPGGWGEYTTLEGEKFYHNTQTQKTQWQHPHKAPLAVALMQNMLHGGATASGTSAGTVASVTEAAAARPPAGRRDWTERYPNPGKQGSG